ncbi:zinc-binding alcohol dehydrogenase domain-containing protein [Fusarium bulbicola]|nr:zinc-binding alcohol dehydrogenase domain-containing protein [Fusarium bulbicola]
MIKHQQSALIKSLFIKKSYTKSISFATSQPLSISRSRLNQHAMSQNRGAVNPSARAPLEVRPLDTPTPGPGDILVKNELISINPVEVSITKNDLFKSKYPCVIGTSFGGQVIAVGEGVSDFKVGDKVAAYASPTNGDKFAAYQAYPILADVVAAQGGGTVYATQPAFGPETLPESVVRHFTSWPFVLHKEGNEHFTRWAFHEFFAKGIASGKLIPTQIERVSGGFEAINSALDILKKGVSNSKVVVELEK